MNKYSWMKYKNVNKIFLFFFNDSNAHSKYMWRITKIKIIRCGVKGKKSLYSVCGKKYLNKLKKYILITSSEYCVLYILPNIFYRTLTVTVYLL